MRCNYNDLICQEYVQRITYLSRSARWLSRRKALRHGLRRVPPHPAVRAARDARHRLLGAIGQDRAFRLLLSARDRGRGLKLQDDGRESIYYANPPRLELGGTGLIWTLPSSARSTRSICRPTWTSLRKVRYRRIFTRRRNPASRSRLGATFERRMHWGGDVGPLRAFCPPPVRRR